MKKTTNVRSRDLETDETQSLISADKVKGTAAHNTRGKKLGTVENVMIDKQTGQVVYAVMSFGGFLGIGDRHHPLPWAVLKYDTNEGGYVVNLDKRRLAGAPTFGCDENIDWEDSAWTANLHRYYGVPPYGG